MTQKTRPHVTIEPIHREDLGTVGTFLHDHMNSRISAAGWERSFQVPWDNPLPDFGYRLAVDGELVGVYTRIGSQRTIDGQPVTFCNLAAWCVLPEHRLHSLGLLKKVLADRELHMTDLSPRPDVAKLMRRFGFVDLDTTWYVMPNLPWWRRFRVVTDPDRIDARLTGQARQVFRDHRELAAVQHLLLETRAGCCHVIYRRTTKKRVPCSMVLHVSAPDVLHGRYQALGGYFLFRERTPFTIFEARFLSGRPRCARRLLPPQSKLFRSQSLAPDQVDNLYSELVTLADPRPTDPGR